MKKSFNDVFYLVKKIYTEKSYPIEKVDTNYGDRYYSECGVEYLFDIDGFRYGIGYCIVTEDADDWAQAESYTNEWIHKYTNDSYGILEYVNADFMYDLLKVNKRDYLISILNIKT